MKPNSGNEYTYQWQPEDYGDEEYPILKISKSSLGSYKWCPKRYEFQYKERMPIETTEVMIKGSIIHNAREDFFNEFDIKKAEDMSYEELVNYCMELHPIDDYSEMYEAMSIFEANRFIESKQEGTTEDFIPVINEIMLDAKIVINKDENPKYPLKQDYIVHLQGIIDRMFREGNRYIPMELKTGGWKDWKTTMMRKEMAFYKILFENTPDEKLIEWGLDPEIPISHWGWYYPVSNYIETEPVKQTSINAVMRGITQLIKAYEDKHNGGEQFPTKYYFKTCQHCSFMPICDAAQSEVW